MELSRLLDNLVETRLEKAPQHKRTCCQQLWRCLGCRGRAPCGKRRCPALACSVSRLPHTRAPRLPLRSEHRAHPSWLQVEGGVWCCSQLFGSLSPLFSPRPFFSPPPARPRSLLCRSRHPRSQPHSWHTPLGVGGQRLGSYSHFQRRPHAAPVPEFSHGLDRRCCLSCQSSPEGQHRSHGAQFVAAGGGCGQYVHALTSAVVPCFLLRLPLDIFRWTSIVLPLACACGLRCAKMCLETL